MVEVTVHTVGGEPVVALRGVGDGEVLGRVAFGVATLVREDGVRVVDVSGLSLLDRAAVRAFLAHLAEQVELWAVTVVCSRLSGRRVLRQVGGPDLTVAIDASDVIGSAVPA